MPYSDEQRRKGQILKERQQAKRDPRVTVKQLADRVGVSKRQIENIYSGKTWNLGTVHLMMRELDMTDDDFDGVSDFAQESADQAIWRRFPDDVQVFLLFAGAWAAKYPEGRRKDEIDRAVLFMLDRDDGP